MIKKRRTYFNILLLAFLIILSIRLIIFSAFYSTPFTFRSVLGISFTIALVIMFFKNKNVFTLLLAITLIIGNFAGLTLLDYMQTYSAGIRIKSIFIPIYWGQPFFSILLFVYLVFNLGFFRGIASKEYWNGFLTRKEDLELTSIKK